MVFLKDRLYRRNGGGVCCGQFDCILLDLYLVENKLGIIFLVLSRLTFIYVHDNGNAGSEYCQIRKHIKNAYPGRRHPPRSTPARGRGDTHDD
jgi:hypothetical protein